MPAEDGTDLLGALEALRPTKGAQRSTCLWLSKASEAELAAVRNAFARGNTYTSIANTMRRSGARVTLPGIRDHFNGDCDTCRISLRS